MMRYIKADNTADTVCINLHNFFQIFRLGILRKRVPKVIHPFRTPAFVTNVETNIWFEKYLYIRRKLI